MAQKKGPWKREANDFAEFKESIREVLRNEPANSKWMVAIEVRKSGNPIHEYRIVLSPGS